MVVDEQAPHAAAYVVGDVHGHRQALAAALRAAGLVDEQDTWAGGTTKLAFLGDFFDRGPDGVGVVDLVRQLQGEAEAAGGEVIALLGNHEILALGRHLFGDREVPSDFGPRSFGRSWRLNGGQDTDQESLTEAHVAWLRGLPVLAELDDHLLMHSDTIEYFGWGDSIAEINANVGAVLAGEDISDWWECWRRMTTRYAFRGTRGGSVADEVMAMLGGRRIVHGHSVIADQLGIDPVEVEGPYLYAQGKVLGVDGGVFVGGPCLVVPLPWADPESAKESSPASSPESSPESAAVAGEDQPVVEDSEAATKTETAPETEAMPETEDASAEKATAN